MIGGRSGVVSTGSTEKESGGLGRWVRHGAGRALMQGRGSLPIADLDEPRLRFAPRDAARGRLDAEAVEESAGGGATSFSWWAGADPLIFSTLFRLTRAGVHAEGSSAGPAFASGASWYASTPSSMRLPNIPSSGVSAKSDINWSGMGASARLSLGRRFPSKKSSNIIPIGSMLTTSLLRDGWSCSSDGNAARGRPQ